MVTKPQSSLAIRAKIVTNTGHLPGLDAQILGDTNLRRHLEVEVVS